MKKILTILVLLSSTLGAVSAQQKTAASEYSTRYQMLVDKFGPTGLGIETVILKWETDYPEDMDMLRAKFSYYLTKSISTEVVSRDSDRYLGQKPLMSLKDSLGNDVYYFQENIFDEELFSTAIQTVDKSISLKPLDLSLRINKITALLSYEKEEPDLAAQTLRSLVDYNGTSHPKWTYADTAVDDEFFCGAVQEYCYSFFKTGSPTSFEAFLSISERMASLYPKNPLYQDNIGSYYQVYKKDEKQALKYYGKALKLDPNDYTAVKNCIIIARRQKNTKLEKKYLQTLVKITPDETEKASAQIRLSSLK